METLREALADLLDWAEHDEGRGRLRRIEAIDKARTALESVSPATPTEEEK